MAAPLVYTYSFAALIAAHTSFRDLIDSATPAGSIKIRSATDVLLSTVPLSDPCGTVHGTTGQLTFSIAGPDTNAAASGTAAYAEICDGDGLPHLSLPAQSGAVAVPGVVVLNTLTIVSGGTVSVISATIG